MIKRIIAALLLTACVAVTQDDEEWASGIGQLDQVTKGLISYWSMRNSGTTVFDEISGRDATSTNTPEHGYSFGLVNVGTRFNGTNFCASSSFVWGISGGYTLSAWINIPVKANRTTSIFASDLAVAGASLTQFRVDSNMVVRFVTFTNDTTTINNFVGATTLATSRWYHILATYSSVAGANIYIDGTLDGSSATAGTHNNSSGAMYIGARNDSAAQDDANRFLGYIDEVRIYNRALTTDEIKQLYRMGNTINQNR